MEKTIMIVSAVLFACAIAAQVYICIRPQRPLITALLSFEGLCMIAAFGFAWYCNQSSDLAHFRLFFITCFLAFAFLGLLIVSSVICLLKSK